MKTLIETLPMQTSTRPKSLLICLLMSLLSAAAQAQAPVELTSITSTTNGVRVAWTDPGPGQAYTVQVRESLTSGAWRNGAMRYRWPWPYTNWADAPRSLPAARYYRVLAQPARQTPHQLFERPVDRQLSECRLCPMGYCLFCHREVWDHLSRVHL